MALLLLGGTAAAQQPGGSPYPAWNPQPVPVPVSMQPRPLPAAMPARPLPLPTATDAPSGPVQKTFYQQPPTGYQGDAPPDLSVSLEPPGAERLLMLHSEGHLFERWIEEGRGRGERYEFPKEPTLAREGYLGRDWPQRPLYVEPNYVNHRRLFFEELNSERYGWDLGFFNVALSTVYFYKDAALFPYHYFTDPCRRYDSSAGKCLPGDPVPYRLYPEGLSATGALGEAAVIVTLLAIFP